jgi:hypothetical protein
MALIFEKTKPKGFHYREWYQQNKERLSAKRKKLYAENPEYRQRALEASKKHRDTEASSMLDDNVFFTQAAQDVDTTISTLREWRKKHYFPEPKHRNGRLWFTEHQVFLLKSLKAFFRVNGKKTWKSNRYALKDLVESVWAKWEE